MSNLQTGTLLLKLRKKYNFTIQNVAEKIGVSKASVSKWESGDYIKTEHLFELAKLYGVSFTELFYGKLNNESDIDYWKRNYELSNFELEEINLKNEENLKTLFEHCKMVKKRFKELIVKWAKNELKANELEEFKFVKKYFKFDSNYENTMRNYITLSNEEDEKKFVIETIERIESFDKKSKEWELNKLYDFIYDYRAEKIRESRSLKGLEYMLSIYSQIEKDIILYGNLHIKKEVEEDVSDGFILHKIKKIKEYDRTIDEIEQIPFFKVIINSGANKLYQYQSNNIQFDQEVFDAIEGKFVEINNDVYNKHSFMYFSGETKNPILDNWKLYSYNDYLEFIDKDGTEKLRDIVNLKNSNPIKYYEKMIERESIKC